MTALHIAVIIMFDCKELTLPTSQRRKGRQIHDEIIDEENPYATCCMAHMFYVSIINVQRATSTLVLRRAHANTSRKPHILIIAITP